MRRSSRRLPIAKWTGLGLCVAILAAGALSLSTGFSVNLRGARGRAFVLSHGRLSLVRWNRTGSLYDALALHIHETVQSSEGALFAFLRPESQTLTSPDFTIITTSVPLLYPLLLAAVPTIVLFRRDRRARPGHCRNCGYDLTANTTGICPECGTKIEPVPAEPPIQA